MTIKLAYEDILDKFNARTVSGKFGGLFMIPIDPDTGAPYKITGGGGGGGGDVTIADGADQAVGARADAAVIDPATSASQISYIKGLLTLNGSTLGPAVPGTAAAKSMLIAGLYQSPTAVRTSGQMSALQTDIRGNLLTRVYGTPVTGTDAFTNSLSMFSNEQESTGGTHLLGIASAVFNGTTWDRQRGDTFGIRTQPAQRAGTNRSKLITTTTSEVIPANANSWFLANDSAADILINIGAPAVSVDTDTDGTFKLRAGERLSSRDVIETGAVNAIVVTGTARLKARST